MGDAVATCNPRFAFHCSPVLEVHHTAGWPRHLVGEFCKERLSVNHALVLHIGGVCWRDLVDTRHMDPLGSTVHAAVDRRSSTFLGNSKGVLLYRSGFGASHCLVRYAGSPSLFGRWRLRACPVAR